MNKKVLFYLQPQTIRNDPRAFEWIFLKYRDLADGLAKNGIRSGFLVDDRIKEDYGTTDQKLFSPSDFGIRFNRTDWPAFWADILSNQHIEEKESLLQALWDIYNFEIVFCWNYDATLDRFCREREITTLYQELGMIRNPALYQMDFEGLLWKSSLPRLYEKFKDDLSVGDARLDAFVRNFRAGVRHSREDVIRALNLDSRKPIVLIPLQVEDDSNIIVGSPFARMADFVSFCLNQITDIDAFNILIKKHPAQPDLAIPGVESMTSLYSEFGNLSLLNAADYVLTLNSSMGFEGLCLGKNVFTLGKSPYSGLGFTADLKAQGRYRIVDYKDFFARLREREHSDDGRRFLYFALFHYHLTEGQMFNGKFYAKLFDLLDKTSDRDEIYMSDIRRQEQGKMKLEFTGERYVPWMEEAHIGYEHLHRYAYACQFVEGKRVLDLASGEGYGSYLLARTASFVLGIDIDRDSIRHASNKYIKKNLRFTVGSILEIPIEDENHFDVIVCFEALEHVDDHDKLLKEVKRLLAPGGLFIVSTPNKRVYSDEPNYDNPFHVHELYFDEFQELLGRYFVQVKFFGQRIYANSNIWPIFAPEKLDLVEYVIERNPQEFIFVEKEKKVSLYFIAIASEAAREVEEKSSQLVDISNELLRQKDQHLFLLTADRDRLSRVIAEIVSDRDRIARERVEAVTERDGQIASLNEALSEGKEKIAALNIAVTEHDGQIANLRQTITERDDQIVSLNQALSEGTEKIAALSNAVTERDGLIDVLNRHLAEHQTHIKQILNSRSWRYTRILRLFGRISRGEWAAVWASMKRYAGVAGTTTQFLPSVVSQGERETKQTSLKDSPRNAIASANSFLNTDCAKPAKKKILLVSYFCPTRAHAGGLRILDIYSLIKTNFPAVRLDLFTHPRPEIDGGFDDIDRIFDNVYFSPTEELTLDGLLNRHEGQPRYDVIDVQYHQAAHDLKGFRKVGGKILFTPMESQSRVFFIDMKAAFRERGRLSLQKMAWSVKQLAEEIVFSFQADEVVCVSRPDAALLRAITCLRKVKSIDTGISGLEFADALANRSNGIAPERKQNKIIFIAYFGSETNVIALQWYLENVHPLVKAQVPDYVLSVVGRGDLTPFLRYRDPAVELVGEVTSIAPQIEKAKVGIAPALGGAGFRGKVNQYAIFGVPCVASPIAAKGLAYRDGFNIFVAADPEQFARRCVELLHDANLNMTIGQRAKETCLARYTWESKLKAICNIYNLDGPT